MVVSVVIPARVSDLPKAQTLAASLRGAGEVIIETEGNRATARNLGASKARYDELFFVDSDIEGLELVDLSSLDGYGFQLAQPYFEVHPRDAGWGLLQNVSMMTGIPFSFWGGAIYVRASTFARLEGFRVMPSEDTDLGWRAYLSGIPVSTFPFTVRHPQPLHLEHGFDSPLVTDEGIWGIP